MKKRYAFIAGCACVIGALCLAAFFHQKAGTDAAGPVSEPGTEARRAQVKAYLDEFAGLRFERSYPKTSIALTDAFTKLPAEVFREVTGRGRPMIFVPVTSTGIARYANATEFVMREDDPPTFWDGFYLVLLSDELEDAPSPQAIEGVVLHEIAHRYLEHLRSEEFTCEMERETNRLVRQWGGAQEYQQASAAFGSKKAGDSPCYEEKK